MQWRPEWQVPTTPHDLTKRERGQKFSVCGSADLVLFKDKSREWDKLEVIFEFKAPHIDQGRSQLLRYLSCEPLAKMGYWTNGVHSLAIYKRHTSDWVYEENAALPEINHDLSKPPEIPPSWERMITPSEAELSGVLRRLLATVVIGDSGVSRREDQLRELVHIIFTKLESDAIASRTANHKKPVEFRIYGDSVSKVAVTAQCIRDRFARYFKNQQNRIFLSGDRGNLLFDDETIFNVVAELYPYRILGDDIDILSKAFQIFRTSALKSGEGQYLTPLRIVRPAVMAMEITSADKVIDPACGTGSFLVETLRQVAENEFPSPNESWHLVKWANDNLYGIDKDDLGIKLTRAVMVAMRDGSTHALSGDAVRVDQWRKKYPRLSEELGTERSIEVAEQFTVVITNPPFGVDLKVSASDARAANYSISEAASGKPGKYIKLEIGLIYLELAYRFLRVGGRVGIVLPETYFFSHSYRWLTGWLNGRLALRGILNIPMEAFEEFCRAKTNFYIFEKVVAS